MRFQELLLVAGLCMACAAAQDRALAVRPGPEAREARTALVIGNGGYKDAPLRNPVNDAQAMSRALRACGFQVAELEDADRPRMREAIRAFGSRIAEGGVGLFYFAGHGMQVKGRNYLVPVGADIASEDEVASEALEVDAVLAKMESAHNRLNILILDACRNNPFGRSFRGGPQGLAQMDAPTGTFVAFATAPGRTAADGGASNGLYTAALLRQLGIPGLRLEDVFKRTRAEVLAVSAQQQTPWENSSIVGDFYFLPGAAPAPEAQPPAAKPAPGTLRPPTEEEGKVLDLIRSAHGSTEPIRNAARPLAAKGSPYGIFGLGWINKHSMERFRALQAGAKQGIPLAMVGLAEFMLDSPLPGTDKAEARRLLERARSLGEPEADFASGRLLGLGKLGPADPSGAEGIFVALTREHPEYCWRVGDYYWRDLDIQAPESDAGAKGLPWLERAAELDDVRALKDLGFAYRVGLHVPKDLDRSRSCYLQGATAGDVDCMDELAGLCLKEHDAKGALRWYQEAADRGDDGGLAGLSRLYREGLGVPRDLAKAAEFLRPVAERGNPWIQQDLAACYEKGEGVPQSDADAYFWYARAAVIVPRDRKAKDLKEKAGARLKPAERAKIDARVAKIPNPHAN